MKNKIFYPKRKKTRTGKSAGLGFFVVAIALVWFASWKLFGTAGDIGGGVAIPGEPVVDESATPAFTAFQEPDDYPVVLMFDNSPEARPYHSGLSEAVAVYETLVEGGATRLMAVFAGAPQGERIGPIRSARPYFVEIAAGWSGFYWHAGGSPEGLSLIPKTDVTNLNEISGLGVRYFWRDTDIERPHNLFTSGNLVALGIRDFELENLPNKKLLWQWYSEKDARKIPAGDDPIQNMYVDFSEGVLFDASYEYDTSSELYQRVMGGEAHKDLATGEQLLAANVIIQKVPAEGYYPSGYGRIILEMQGEGDVLVFQKGTVAVGKWKKEGANSQTEWLDNDGDPIKLLPGQTWVEVVPGDRDVTFE